MVEKTIREIVEETCSCCYDYKCRESRNPKARERCFSRLIPKKEEKSKFVELDIWTDKVERFRNEFASMNDCIFDGSEVITIQGVDKRYSLQYRVFNEEVKYPEQGYYQLNNCFEGDF